MKPKRQHFRREILKYISDTGVGLAGYYNKQWDHKVENNHGWNADSLESDSDDPPKEIVDGCTDHHEAVIKRHKELVRSGL